MAKDIYRQIAFIRKNIKRNDKLINNSVGKSDENDQLEDNYFKRYSINVDENTDSEEDCNLTTMDTIDIGVSDVENNDISSDIMLSNLGKTYQKTNN